MAEQGRLTGLLTRACNPADTRTREAAFDELLRLLMIFVRAGMGDKLRDHRESVDVCQSLARSFVEDFGRGALMFESEAALAGYLQRTVRSKLADLSRHDMAQKRGAGQRAQGLGAADSGAPMLDPACDEPGPGSMVIAHEAQERAMAALADHEKHLVQLRSQGLSWEEIARRTGKDPAAVRQQFSRLQRRITDVLEH